MDFDDVVIGIRAILSSTATLCCLNSLLSDFKNIFGCDMPLFGHINHIEFLKSLKNTIKLFGNPNNPSICLIESKKSSHIISLVKRQKNKKKIPHFYRRPESIILPELNSEAYIPPHKRQIYNDIFMQNLENSKTLSDKGLAEAKSTLIPNKTFTINGNKNMFDFNPLINNQYVDLAQVGNNYNFHDIKTEPGNAEYFDSEKADSCLNEVFSDNDSYFSISETSSAKSSSVQESIFSYGFVNNGMKLKLKKLIEKYPNGIWCCDLPILFQETYNIKLDYREFGYTSLIQMVFELPDVFKCYRPGHEDWILLDSSLPSSQHDEIISKLQLNKNGFLEVEANLKKLLMNCETVSESGMDSERILELYEKMYGVPLDYESYGFKDFRPLLENLEGNFSNCSNDDNKAMEIPKIKSSSPSPIACEEALPAITAENDIFYDIFPEDVVGPEEKFFEFELNQHFSVGEKVEVCAAEVWSPDKFYLQLNKYNDKFNKFMFELQNFYNSYLNKYKMPDATIRPNQVCVGFYNSDPEYPEEWNRAIILKVVNEKSVVVHFVDYGTVARLKKTRIRFLHRKFHYMPVQAFPAKLTGIEPLNGGEWPLSISKKFLEFLKVPYLIAEMMEVDFKKRTTSVILYDPFKKPTLNINSKLVMDNVAKYSGTRPKKKTEKEKQREKNLSTTPVNCNKQKLKNANEFLEINDCWENKNYFPSINFNKSCAKETKKESKDKEEIVSFEFEDVPDLEDSVNKKEDTEQQTMMFGMKGLMISTEALSDVTDFQLKQNTLSTSTKPRLLNSQTHSGLDSSNKYLTGSKQLPPGINQNYRFKDIPQDFLERWDDLRKTKNYLSIELLSKNPDLKEIALINPELALSISSQIAQAYVNSLEVKPKFCANIPKTDSESDLFITPSATEQSVMPSFKTEKLQSISDTLLKVSVKAPNENDFAFPNILESLSRVSLKSSSKNDSILLNTPDSLPSVLGKATSGNDSALPKTPDSLPNNLLKSSNGNDSVLLNTPDSLPSVLSKISNENDFVFENTPDSLSNVFLKSSSGNDSVLLNTPDSLPSVLSKISNDEIDFVLENTPDSLPNVLLKSSIGIDSALPKTSEPLPKVLGKTCNENDSAFPNNPESLPRALIKFSNEKDFALSRTPEPSPIVSVKVSNENESASPKTPEPLPKVSLNFSSRKDFALSNTPNPPPSVLIRAPKENDSVLPKTPELLSSVSVKVSIENDLPETSKPVSKVLKNAEVCNSNPTSNTASKSAANISMNTSVLEDDCDLPPTPNVLPNTSANKNFNGGPEPGPVLPEAFEILPEKQSTKSMSVSPKIQEFIEKTNIQGKVLHIIKMNNQSYICAEELVHSFTFFTNREIADRILQNKRMNFRYEVITKKTNEKLLKELKSTNIFEIINKKRKKKMEVYLLNLQNAVPYLEALGCQTKSYAKLFEDLIANFEKMKNSEPKPP